MRIPRSEDVGILWVVAKVMVIAYSEGSCSDPL